VRGEGDLTFRDLLRALETGGDLVGVAGLSFRRDDAFVRTAARHVSHLDGEIKLPNRAGARARRGTRCWDVPSTSSRRRAAARSTAASVRSSKCGGRNFHTWTIDRIIADITDARQRGARAIFIVDDNITLNVARFKSLCEAIIAAGLSDIDYVVQAMTSAMDASGDDLGATHAPCRLSLRVSRIENILDQDLAFLRAASKNAHREGGADDGQRDTAGGRA